MNARPAAIFFILITVLIDIMGLGLIVPVLPRLAKEMTGSDVAGAHMIGVLTAVYAAMQFLFAPILGALSDRFGRRPVLLVALAGMALDYLLLSIATHLWWLVLGRVVAGITGASVTVANAYVADVTPPEERAKAFGWIGAMFGLGFILGPALGGWLGEHSLRTPFLAAAILSGLNFLYGWFVLPESLPPSARTKPSSMRTAFNPFAPLSALFEYPLLRSLLVVLVILGMATQFIVHTWVLFTEETLHWTPSQNGTALAFYGLLTAISQAWLIAPMIRHFGEKNTILFSLATAVAEFGLLVVMRSPLGLYLSLFIGAFGGIAQPALQGLISRQVSETEQGKVMGAITGLHSLVGVVGPLVATSIFAYGVSLGFPALVFLVAGILALFGTGLMWKVLNNLEKQIKN